MTVRAWNEVLETHSQQVLPPKDAVRVSDEGRNWRMVRRTLACTRPQESQSPVVLSWMSIFWCAERAYSLKELTGPKNHIHNVLRSGCDLSRILWVSMNVGGLEHVRKNCSSLRGSLSDVRVFFRILDIISKWFQYNDQGWNDESQSQRQTVRSCRFVAVYLSVMSWSCFWPTLTARARVRRMHRE